MKAKVVWLKPEDGGRKKMPPLNVKIYVTIKLDKDKDYINWSVYVMNNEHVTDYETNSIVDFVMPDAPRYLLQPGLTFTLREGAKKVAEGKFFDKE